MLEQYGFFMLVTAGLLALIGWVWLIVRAFRQRLLWGLAVLFFPPAILLFLVPYHRKAVGPLVLLLLAFLIGATPYALSYYERHFVPLKPFEQVVDGERRITLTGLKDFDYSTLKGSPDVVVLQMANPDVTDATLGYLQGMDRLRKLDVADTQITDQGLRSIASLPHLEELYLGRTKITDAGFQESLGPKESLLKLDLTGTQVKGKTKRDWKKAKPDREYVD